MTARPLAVVAIGLVALSLASAAHADPPLPPFVQPATGTPVEFDCDRPLVSVFVAPGLLSDTRPSYPDPFVKIGRTPIMTKLAPGTYTVTAESPDITSGSTVFQVGTEPVHVRVRAGSSDMRTMGTLVLAVGITSLLAAIVAEVSYTQASPKDISKSTIVVPLFVVGGVGLGGGLALVLASGTTIEPDGPKLDRRSAVVGLTSRW
jgi:hypothetical protein